MIATFLYKIILGIKKLTSGSEYSNIQLITIIPPTVFTTLNDFLGIRSFPLI